MRKRPRLELLSLSMESESELKERDVDEREMPRSCKSVVFNLPIESVL